MMMGTRVRAHVTFLNNENDSSDNSSDKEVGYDSANELTIDVIKKMNNVELKRELKCRGCHFSGVKAVLVARLIEAVKKNVPVNEFHDDKQHKKILKIMLQRVLKFIFVQLVKNIVSLRLKFRVHL